QFGNPDRLTRLVLTGKDAQTAGLLVDRPLKHGELRSRLAAVGHGYRPLKIDGPDRRIAARANFVRPRRRIGRRERDSLDAFAPVDKVAGWRVVFGRREYAEQFDIIGVEHDRIVARSHVSAVGAARGNREAEGLPGRGRLVEIPDHSDG